MPSPASYSRRGSLRRRSLTADSPDLPFQDNRVVLYIRASTDDQKLTLEGQEFEGRQWAERHGLEVADVFIEPGVSGGKPFLKRKEATKALAFMKRHGIPAILVMNLNRGFRNVDDMRHTVDHLVDNGMSLRIASPDIDARGGYGKFLATVLAAVAELQLAETKDQQRRAFNQMRRDRVALSQNAPFGWDIGEEIPEQTSKSGKPYRRLTPNAAEQQALREIIALYEQRHTLQSIADTLNQRGIKTKQAGKTLKRKGRTLTISGEWKPQTVKSVLEHAELADPVPSSPVAGASLPQAVAGASCPEPIRGLGVPPHTCPTAAGALSSPSHPHG